MAARPGSALWHRATTLIPGGVNSPVRAMQAVGLDEPLFVRRAEGPWLEDVDGKRYVDWVSPGARSSSATPTRKRSRR